MKDPRPPLARAQFGVTSFLSPSCPWGVVRRAGSSKQTMTTMLRQMAAAGLVERRADPGDGRAARIYLTAEARRFRPVAERVLAELDRMADAVTPLGLGPALCRWLVAMMQLRS